jgi:phage gp29-like protein
VRRDYVKADADLLSNALNSGLIRWLVDFNFPDVRRYPKLWVRFDREEDLAGRVQRDEALLRMGLRIPKRYFYETYGVPEPAEGEETL